jgi:zinc transport system permease protein
VLQPVAKRGVRLVSVLYDWLAGLADRGTLPDVFHYAFFVRGLLSVLLLAPLLGGMSHLVVARRLAFFSAALGQAALTGLAIGLVLLGEPLNGAYGGIFGFCFLSALAMVYVKRHASLPSDTLVGVFLSMTLGLGICLLVAVTKRFNIHQVEAVMFGSLLTVTDADLAVLLATGILIAVVFAWIYNQLLLDSLDAALSRVSGVPSALLDYLFVMLLTAAIVVSLKIIGALLVEAMVVVPAAAARNLARTTRSYLVLSVATAFVAGVGGLFISSRLLVPSGGAVVLAMSVLFFVTLALAGVRSLLAGDAAG